MSVQVESSVDAPAESRSHLAGMRSSLEPRYDDVLLVVSELVTNSVRHTNTAGIDLVVETADSSIRVEVSDDGPGFARDAPRGNGLGLEIVDRIADEWGLTPGDRFTVWAKLKRTPV